MIDGQILIGGAWRESQGGGTIPVVNPSDGGRFGSLARGTAADVDAAVRAARAAQDGEWGRMPAFERGRVLARLGQLVLERADELTMLEARDVGKPLRQARADVLALARYLEFYGGAADKVHGATIPYQAGYTVMTLREPHGVTGHIISWNYPMQVFGRSVGAALAMGNAAVLKPGDDASMSALMVGRLALDAGLPAGVLNIVTGYGEEAGAALAAHPGVDHLSFTGSIAAGRLVQQAAATHGCPATLELGGKSPQIVFADADLEVALPLVVSAAIQNAGQSSSAGSRLLVEEGVYNAVVEAVAERFHTLDVGPAEADLDCGPLISEQQKARVDACLAQAHRDRLLLLAEGKLAPNAPEGGFYARPTLLGDVPPEHALAQEEVFGPVLVAMRFAGEAEAIRLGNGTPYGLAAGVWTSDGGRQLRLARALRAGQVFVNNYGAGGGVELPFGGMKSSGFGREKGFEALYGFSALKTIAIRHG
jgi:aldehyde dehydrogenase (NAD+)